jgi:hypothetical protein
MVEGVWLGGCSPCLRPLSCGYETFAKLRQPYEGSLSADGFRRAIHLVHRLPNNHRSRQPWPVPQDDHAIYGPTDWEAGAGFRQKPTEYYVFLNKEDYPRVFVVHDQMFALFFLFNFSRVFTHFVSNFTGGFATTFRIFS